MKNRLFTLTSALILAFAAMAMAAPVPTIELVPNGTSFSVMAANFTKVSGFEMLIQYNPLALQNPQSSRGDKLIGGFFVQNDSASNSTVKIVFSLPSGTIEGSGKLATVSFSPIPGGASKGNVNILGNGYKFTSDNARKTVTVRLTSSAEQNLGRLENDAIVACLNDSLNCTPRVKSDGSVELINQGSGSGTGSDPGVGTGGSSGSGTGGGSGSGTGGGSGAGTGTGTGTGSGSGAGTGSTGNSQTSSSVALASNYATQTGQTASVGMITLPPDQMPASTEKKPDSQPLVTDLRKDMTIPVGGTETATVASNKKPAEKVKEADNKFVSYKSALQFFAAYKGERNAKNLIALFAEPSIPSFTQDPPIALSDGKSTVKIKLLLEAAGNELPKFIVQGATLRKLPTQGEDGFWNMEALPKKDAYDAKLTVIDGERMLEFPLTVTPVTAPLLGKGKKFSEADFAMFLQKTAKFDLNGDKKFDYIDDFIYAANYIVALKIKPEKLKKDESKSVGNGEKKGQPKPKDGKKGDELEKPAPKPADPVKKPAEPAAQK